ncbi:META domain-containing protein [Roseomonas sp. KE0001]|uniref:META domain-containing protein n=1 Tax=Roseomonas sp. KE0001 TaxID=2479201 RepID=UPI0018DF7827|nr:META domain-containing protein [Roseomonas sp. KE0001]MBI0434224.1 META domain-containing protein [Roseomonas sp. KE0001]
MPANAEPVRASGNEPFWSLRIGAGQMRLSRPGLPDRTAPAPAAENLPEGRRYEAAGLALTLRPGPCEDSMSGARFAERAVLEINGERLEGCGGEELPPGRLEDTRWVVTRIAGRPVAAEQPPTLEIDEKGHIAGFDGCNRYAGGLRLAPDGGIRRDGHQGIGTLMACRPAVEEISRAFQAARDGATQWRFAGSELQLLARGAESLRLRRLY